MRKGSQPDEEMLKGTLDMMILRTLVGGDAHGHTIAKVIEHTSEDLLEVEQGSLIRRCIARGPRLGFFLLGRKRKQSQGKVLPADGRRPKQLVRETTRWRQMRRAIGLVMGEEGGAQ